MNRNYKVLDNENLLENSDSSESNSKAIMNDDLRIKWVKVPIDAFDDR